MTFKVTVIYYGPDDDQECNYLQEADDGMQAGFAVQSWAQEDGGRVEHVEAYKPT